MDSHSKGDWTSILGEGNEKNRKEDQSDKGEKETSPFNTGKGRQSETTGQGPPRAKGKHTAVAIILVVQRSTLLKLKTCR